MKIFCQQDYKTMLGNTRYSVARYGCLTADIAMIYDYIHKLNVNPAEMAKKLEYNSDGLLLWPSLSKIGMKLVSRQYTFNKKVIDSELASPNRYVVLQVNNNHWVWPIGRWIPILGYKIVDPFRGDKCYTNRYKNNITGLAVVE